jgi:hypothetical protein
MTKTATRWGKIVLYGLIISAVFFGFPSVVFATQYQQCSANSNCTVGEFLYDDNYQTISTSTCTLTSRYPNGDVLLNAVPMSASSDGWYSYSVGTSGLSNGIYRGQMCCVTSGDNICLDKTFEVSATLSNLVSDIWAAPNRSLNNFTDLISGIWTHPTRKLTSSNLDNGTSLATTANITALSTQLSTVETKIVTIDSKVTSLQTQVGTILTNTNDLLAKWGSYSQSDIINYVDTLESQLGNNTQTCSDNSVFGQVQCIKDKWGSETASSIYTAANNAYTSANDLRSEVGFSGKSTNAYAEIMAIKAYVDTLESSIGSTSDTSSTASIFGRIQQVKEAIASIDNSTLNLNDLLAKWDDLSAIDIYNKVKDLSTQVAAINSVSNVENITNNNITQTTDLSDIKNQLLAMRALLDVNRIQLEKIDNKPIIKTWLENGSVIFKNLITNPSSSVTQNVSFSYNLPAEVKESDIIKKSNNLTIKYDTSKSSLLSTGEFSLKPKETLVVEIEVKDIWTIPQEKIDSLRRQANDLFAPLKKTSYFAQGATLNSDILASLDRIIEIQKSSDLPEEKIKNYRDAQIELDSVTKKMDSLKEIVTSAGSIGTLSGFIGGVQTLGVWGIIVVLIAGFVFLAIYIKSLTSKRGLKTNIVSEPREVPCSPRSQSKANKKLILILFIFGLSSVSTGAICSNFLSKKIKSSAFISPPAVLSATDSVSPTPTPTKIILPTDIPTPTDNPIPTDTPTETPTEVPTTTPSPVPTKVSVPIVSDQKRAIVVPSINSFVNVRQDASRDSLFVSKIASGSELNVISEKYNDLGEKWLKISNGQVEGWVLGQLIQYIQTSSAVTPSAKVTINVPSHDVVYIYSKPSYNASITYKINETQVADILLETKMWAKVILSRINIQGWVSQDFIEKNTP